MMVVDKMFRDFRLCEVKFYKDLNNLMRALII